MLVALFILIICSMGLATAKRALQALLDQSEDEIVNPKRVACVLRDVQRMRESWRRCVHLSTVTTSS